MYEQNVVSEAVRICGRHKARLLTELERANCPLVYLQAVTSSLNWLRDDISAMLTENDQEGKKNEPAKESRMG